MSRTVVALALFTCALASPLGASAQAEHTVRAGQSLARIAQRHNVSVTSLAAANGLTREAALRPGQILRIPERGTHYVAQGETLASIARHNACSVADLTRLNRLRGPLRIGQRLVLPGFEPPRARGRAARQWGEPRNPGVATLYRRAVDRRFRVALVDRRGRAQRPAIRRLREIMRQRETRGGRLGPAPPARLVEILARISDHFGGRTITIVSGYRTAGGDTRESSRHIQGHALDLRIQGVPADALRDYVRATFDRVGVGYYPRSGFVHIDVRDRSAYWVDWSRPGEHPQYQRRGEPPPADATPDEVRRAGMGGDDVGEEGEGAAAREDDGSRNPDEAEIEEERANNAPE